MAIKSIDELEKILQPKIKKAVTNVVMHFSDELKKYINSEIYENNKEIISKNILSSLKSTNYSVGSLPSGASAEIFVRKDIINNLKDKNGNSIETILDDALLDRFIEYCNKNYAKVLKAEMKKQGIPIK